MGRLLPRAAAWPSPGVALPLLLASFLLLLLLPQPASGDVLLIGTLVESSGGWEVGDAAHAGAELAQEAFVSDSWAADNGHSIEFAGMNYDTVCTPSNALGKAAEYALLNSTSAWVGPGCSSSCIPVAKLSAYYGMPMVSFGAMASELASPADYPFFFRTNPNGELFMTSLAAFAWAEGFDSAALLTEALPFFSTLAEKFAGAFESLGGGVQTRETFTASSLPSVVTALANVKASSAMAIVSGAYVDAGEMLFSNCGELCQAASGSAGGGGGGGYVWLTMVTFYDDIGKYSNSARANMVGLFSCVDAYKESAATTAFVRDRFLPRMKSKYGLEPDAVTGLVYGLFMYDAVTALGKAFEASKKAQLSGTTPPLTITDALQKTHVSFDGVTGPVSWRPESNDKYEQLVQVVNLGVVGSGDGQQHGPASLALSKGWVAVANVMHNPSLGDFASGVVTYNAGVTSTYAGGSTTKPTSQGCLPGTYRAASASNAASSSLLCVPCPMDTFNELFGQAACSRCPERTHIASGRTGKSALDCVCDKGSYHVNGSGRSSAEGGTLACSDCPALGQCDGGSALPKCTDGVWRDYAPGHPVVFHECFPKDVCVSANCTCAANHQGLMCRDCEGSDFYQVRGRCFQCPSTVPWVYIGLAVVGAAAMYAVPMWVAKRMMKSPASVTLSTTIKYVQLWSIVMRTMKLANLADDFHLADRLFGSLLLSVTEVLPWACFGMPLSLNRKIAVALLFPAIYIVSMVAVCYFRTRRSSGGSGESDNERQLKDLKELVETPADGATGAKAAEAAAETERGGLSHVQLQHIVATIFALKLIHLSVSLTFLGVFDCSTFISTGQSHVEAHLSVVCGSEEHSGAVGCAVAGLLIWTIGIPASFVLMERAARARGYHAGTEYIDTALGKSLHSALRAWSERRGTSPDKIFDAVDVDGSGSISAAEFFEELLDKKLNIYVPLYRREQLFTSWTQDHESDLSKAEFGRIVLQLDDWTHMVLKVLGNHYKQSRTWWEVILLAQPVLLVTSIIAFKSVSGSDFTMLLLLSGYIMLQVYMHPFARHGAQTAQTACLVCVLLVAVIGGKLNATNGLTIVEESLYFFSFTIVTLVGVSCPLWMSIMDFEEKKKADVVEKAASILTRSSLLERCSQDFIECLAKTVNVYDSDHENIKALKPGHDAVCFLGGSWDVSLDNKGQEQGRATIQGCMSSRMVGDSLAVANALRSEDAVDWRLSFQPQATEGAPLKRKRSSSWLYDNGDEESPCCCMVLSSEAIALALHLYPFDRDRITKRMESLEWKASSPHLSLTIGMGEGTLDRFWDVRRFQSGLKLLSSADGGAQGSSSKALQVAITVLSVFYLGMVSVPYQYKKGTSWYRNFLIVIISVGAVLLASIFRCVEMKIFKFLCVQVVVWQVITLSILDWLRYIFYASPGWEAIDPLSSTFTLMVRFAWVFMESVPGLTRWFRLGATTIFFLGNVRQVIGALFWNEARSIISIDTTNTRVTTNSFVLTVATTCLSVTLTTIVSIWRDHHFEYVSICQSYVPNTAIDRAWFAAMSPGKTEGAELDAAQLQKLAAFEVKRVEVWLGGVRKCEIAVISAILMFLVSVVLGTFSWGYTDGVENWAYAGSSIASWLMLMFGNIWLVRESSLSWPRLFFILTRPQGMMVIFFTLTFFAVAVAHPDPTTPLSSFFGPLMVSIFYLTWLFLDALEYSSRRARVIITLAMIVNLVLSIVVTIFVWKDDPVMADLNGEKVKGELTKYQMWRCCFYNLLALSAGSLWTTVYDWKEGRYMKALGGSVFRSDIINLDSMFGIVEGAGT